MSDSDYVVIEDESGRLTLIMEGKDCPKVHRLFPLCHIIPSLRLCPKRRKQVLVIIATVTPSQPHTLSPNPPPSHPTWLRA